MKFTEDLATRPLRGADTPVRESVPRASARGKQDPAASSVPRASARGKQDTAASSVPRASARGKQDITCDLKQFLDGMVADTRHDDETKRRSALLALAEFLQMVGYPQFVEPLIKLASGTPAQTAPALNSPPRLPAPSPARQISSSTNPSDPSDQSHDPSMPWFIAATIAVVGLLALVAWICRQ